MKKKNNNNNTTCLLEIFFFLKCRLHRTLISFFFLSPSYINIIIAVERKKSDTAPVITRNVLLKVFGLGKIFCLFDISYEIVFFFFSSLNAIRDGFLFWSFED